MEDWISKNQLPIDELFMRTGGDQRKDSDVKREIMIEKILPHYNPIVAVDDRVQIQELWEQEFGLCVVRVTNPGTLPPISLGP